MAKLTFGWFPDTAASNSVEPAVNVTKFGEGYEARTSDSINVVRRNWAMTFSRGRDSGECQDIVAFLKARKGRESFLMVDPLNEPGTWVVRKWVVEPDRGKIKVTANFEEVFES